METILSAILLGVYLLVAVFFARLMQVVFKADYGPMHFLCAAGWPIFIWIVIWRMRKDREEECDTPSS